MTRLRQKYKKLKQKYDFIKNMPFVPFEKLVVTHVPLETIQTVHLLEQYPLTMHEQIEYWDNEAPRELAKFAKEHGMIKREVEREPFSGWVRVRYSMKVVRQSEEGG